MNMDIELLSPNNDENINQSNNVFHKNSNHVLSVNHNSNHEQDQGQDQDLNFREIYHYYYQKGFRNIILSKIFNLLSLVFTLALLYFLIFIVDWKSVLIIDRKNKTIHEEGENIILIFRFILPERVYVLISIIMIGGKLLWDLYDIPLQWRLRRLLMEINIHQDEIEVMPWEHFLPKLLGKTTKNPLQITDEIMRWENYMIAIISERILDRPTLFNLRTTLFYSRCFEWIFYDIILPEILFGYKKDISMREVIAKKIIRKLRMLALISLILSPIAIMGILVYCFFRYTEEIKSNPENTLISRQWTRYAQYRFRCYQELPHCFERRLNSSMVAANSYLRQFYSRSLQIIIRFIVFVLTSFLAILILTAIINEKALVDKLILQRSLLWWLTCFGIVVGILRGLYPPRHAVFDPWIYLGQLKDKVNIPQDWVTYAHDPTIHSEISLYFRPRAYIFIEEILSALLLPYMAGIHLPQCIERLVHFILDNTEDDQDELGITCSLSKLVMLPAESNPCSNEKVSESRMRLNWIENLPV